MSRLALAIGAALAAALALAARGAAHPPAAAPVASATCAGSSCRELHAPRVAAPLALDIEEDDANEGDWARAGRTGGFSTASGEAARPFSEARAAWADGTLYLALYAADDDIRARAARPDDPLWMDDAFRVVFTRGGEERAVDVSPLGVVTDAKKTAGGALDYAWQSGARVGHEADGTVNDPSDRDEEWVLKVAIPLDALGLRGEAGETIGLSIARCDTPRGEPRTCAGWGERGAGVLVLDR